MQTDAGLATAMRISISRLARRLRVERLGLGGTETVLSDIQLAALAALERHDSMTPGELAEHEKVQPPSMTRVIAVLEERGLVLRATARDRPQAGHPHRDAGRQGPGAAGPPPPRGLAGAAPAGAHPRGTPDPPRRRPPSWRKSASLRAVAELPGRPSVSYRGCPPSVLRMRWISSAVQAGPW